jgi:photosystem II stability/assembly factor-like uncharacterized protein
MNFQKRTSGPMKNYSFLFLIILLVFFSFLHRIFSNKDTDVDHRRSKTKSELKHYPSDWAWMQRTFPYWRADKTAHLEALKSAQSMRIAAKNKALTKGGLDDRFFAVAWEFAGPTNIGGRVVDIEFDPLTPNIVYAATATGGVFKSTDMGTKWLPIFDEQAVLTIGDIGIDPINPDIIYIGTGEANGGHNNFPGGGVYKSFDGGSSWQSLGLENTASIGRILVDPSDTQRIFVAAVGSYFAPNPERGVFRSDDGGLTWSKVLFVSDSTGAIDIVMNPNNPDNLLAAMWERVRRPRDFHLYGKTSGIYRSFDGGDSWELLSNGLPNAKISRVGRIGLAMSKSNPDIIYALYNDGRDYLGLFKTTDGGDSWSDVDPDKEIARGTGGFSWFFGQVRVDPTNPNKVFALDVTLMRSTNGGETWSLLNYPGLHVDHHALAFHPNNSDIVIDGNDGGINISQDGGITWDKVDQLPVTQFYEISIDNTNPERLYGGTQDNGTMRTATGRTDDWDIIFGGDGFYVIVDPKDPNIIYAESQFGKLAKSVNGGRNFFSARAGIVTTEPTNWSTPVVMDPNNRNVLYYGTNRVYRSLNGALSWSPISPNLTDGSPNSRLGTITTIAVAPTNSNVIYAGTDDSHVWVSNDYGETWTDVSATLPYRWVTRVVVDPTDENIAYVTFSGLKWKDPQPHVFRTEDMGATWEDISNNLPDAPVNAFAVDPVDPRVLYLGSDVGAYVSFNSGQSWEVLGTGLPMVVVNDMKIYPQEHFLIVGTHGRSMYKLDLSEIVTSIQSPEQHRTVSTFELQQNYPNPFNPETIIKYRIAARSHVRLKVLNVFGQEIRTLVSAEMEEGNYKAIWDGKDELGGVVSSGIYFYRLSVSGAENFVQTKKMIRVK